MFGFWRRGRDDSQLGAEVWKEILPPAGVGRLHKLGLAFNQYGRMDDCSQALYEGSVSDMRVRFPGIVPDYVEDIDCADLYLTAEVLDSGQVRVVASSLELDYDLTTPALAPAAAGQVLLDDLEAHLHRRN